MNYVKIEIFSSLKIIKMLNIVFLFFLFWSTQFNRLIRMINARATIRGFLHRSNDALRTAPLLKTRASDISSTGSQLSESEPIWTFFGDSIFVIKLRRLFTHVAMKYTVPY